MWLTFLVQTITSKQRSDGWSEDVITTWSSFSSSSNSGGLHALMWSQEILAHGAASSCSGASICTRNYQKPNSILIFWRHAKGMTSFRNFYASSYIKSPFNHQPHTRTFKRNFWKMNCHWGLEEPRNSNNNSSTYGSLRGQLAFFEFRMFKLHDAEILETFVKKCKKTHLKKLNHLGIYNELPCNPDLVIHSISSKPVPNRVKTLLAFDLDFRLPVWKLNFYRYHLLFEKLLNSLSSLPLR